MNTVLLQGLEEIVAIYTKAKKYILLSEQLDPESKSNIAVFKEQRDAFDHVMRSLGEGLKKGATPNGEYIAGQFDKAKGHIFRAAYDALDGIAISCKIRLADAMKGVSNEAITAVYPKYYEDIIVVDQVDRQIAEMRNNKDIGRGTLQNMEAYSVAVDRLHELTMGCLSKVPAFKDWHRRNEKSDIRKVFFFKLGPAIILILVGILAARYLKP